MDTASLCDPPHFAKTVPDDISGKLGSLKVRLANTKAELEAAQALRYKIFYKEMSANLAQGMRDQVLDQDAFDPFCDHLIVIETDPQIPTDHQNGEQIVGTYRLLRQDVATTIGGFYTQGEFDIDSLITRHPGRRFLELGRSCVLKEYRKKRTVELLWHGIWAYVLKHQIDVLFGCASLEGSDADLHAEELDVLSKMNPAPEAWQVSAHRERYVKMSGAENPVAKSRKTLLRLPSLIKGYLRLGAYIGDGAVLDEAFGTTDVLIVLPIENINPRYVTYYGEDAGRHAA